MNIPVNLTTRVKTLLACEKWKHSHGRNAVQRLDPLQILREAYPTVCAGQGITEPCAAKNEPVGSNFISESHTGDQTRTLNHPHEYAEALDERLSRYRQVLFFLAYRVLRNRKDAEDAVQNCFSAASLNLPGCEGEGAFRSWLVRILIDEASLILHMRGAGLNNAQQ
jgi:Sigma-70 region 2